MAQIPYRVNLSAAAFPFLLSKAVGHVIVPGLDQNYDRRIDPQGEQKTPGIPQAIYLENVLPSIEGYQSIGYVRSNPLPGTSPATDYVILEVKRPDGHWPIIMAFKIGEQRAFFFKDTVTGWVEIPVMGSPPDNFPADPSLYFSTIIQGNILIWCAGMSFLYGYGGTNELTYNNASYAPAGVLDDVICFLSSYNYLILIKNLPSGVAVLWSSTVDPFDFSASLVTGAGGGAIATTQGNALAAYPCPEGFYIYTKNNIILAVYTGNSRYPFKFVPVKDSQGISTSLDVYTDLDESAGLVFTRHGQFHVTSGDRAVQVMPEASEFFERANTYDIFDRVNLVFSVGRRPVGYRKIRPYAFGSRYLLLSYKETAIEENEIFDGVIVYDKLLNRYGKLKFKHTKIFTFMEYEGDLTVGIRADRLVLGFLDADTGQVGRWTFVRDPARDDLSPAINHEAVLVLGRYQYVRSRDICLDEVILEGSEGKASPDIKLYAMPSRVGTGYSAITELTYVPDSSNQRTYKYYSTAEGRNVSLCIVGSFDMASAELRFHLGGDS
jgi:hypothetical protein